MYTLKKNLHILLQNLAKFLKKQALLCKSDHCFIRHKKTKNKQKITFLCFFFDFVNDVGFCYTLYRVYTIYK
jgi:hypothetical protein